MTSWTESYLKRHWKRYNGNNRHSREGKIAGLVVYREWSQAEVGETSDAATPSRARKLIAEAMAKRFDLLDEPQIDGTLQSLYIHL